MNNTLFFDSSTDCLVVGLAMDDNLISLEIQKGKKDHSGNIIPLIDEVLSKNSLSIKDIGKIICGIGPGSYTGIRVACMTAKMLGYANNIPVYTISSLILLTSGYKKDLVRMIDCRNNNYFAVGLKKDLSLYLNEGFYSLGQIKYKKQLIINKDNVLVDYFVINQLKTKVNDVNSLTPNYLRITEAQRNLGKW